jgi:threonylcarbamoyladenosine tRNA methylthiotransferase MtaB
LYKVAFVTLGCRLNQAESDSLAASFVVAGYSLVDSADQADIVCVNSCTVTAKADRKSRHALRQAAGANPQALMVLTGCAASPEAGSLDRFHTENVLIVPPEDKAALVHLVDAHVRGESNPSPLQNNRFAYLPAISGSHTRNIVKIQDGCDLFCSFCIIPRVRGRGVSRPHQDIMENITRLVNQGCREIVLSGVNMSRYWDNGLDFTNLVHLILDLPLDFRVRIASLEPDNLGSDFPQLFQHPKLCSSIHLCLQSGNDRILEAMRRRYRTRDYQELVNLLRTACPKIRISTDLLVGFPGETRDEHQSSLDFCRRLELSGIHVFSYSRRPGTSADRLPNQVSSTEIRDRHASAQALALALSQADALRWHGSQELILVETAEIQNKQLWLSGLGANGLEITAQAGPGTPNMAESVQRPGKYWNQYCPVIIDAKQGSGLPVKAHLVTAFPK